MKNRALTQRQKEIFDFLKEFIEEGGYPPSLRDICERFGIKGPKNAAKHLDALERKGFIKRNPNISRAIEIIDSAVKNAVSIPIVGHVRAGSPHPAIEDILGHVALDSRFFKCRDAFMLKVEGDSMTGAGIDEGDFLIVRPEKDASDGEIVVAMLDGQATVKRFFRKGGSVMLKPENPNLEPIIIDEMSGEFSIIGKVISVIKQVEK
ncbi:MAG: repressor LexA [Deltaproteobacteria bacterium]|nr:repressor LexA [Deltaproteobacteria bacterium]